VLRRNQEQQVARLAYLVRLGCQARVKLAH
jgi:hypothetical protein